uniref:Uncharacterized protein n=1 Tax=Anguilla anguilla TaxID=7936 RepID=A0A0E9PXG6_ANGAN
MITQFARKIAHNPIIHGSPRQRENSLLSTSQQKPLLQANMA